MTVRDIFRLVVALVGLVAIALAAALTFAPGSVSSILPVSPIADATPLSEGDVRALTFGLLGLGCILWVVWTSGPDRLATLSESPFTGADSDFETLREDPPEHTTDGVYVGGRFDQQLERAAIAAANDREDDDARETLRTLAVDVITDTRECSREQAETLVADGEWTDDPIAAAYVADSEATLSLYRRLLAWLRPWRTTTSRIERSVGAIEAELEDEVGT